MLKGKMDIFDVCWFILFLSSKMKQNKEDADVYAETWCHWGLSFLCRQKLKWNMTACCLQIWFSTKTADFLAEICALVGAFDWTGSYSTSCCSSETTFCWVNKMSRLISLWASSDWGASAKSRWSRLTPAQGLNERLIACQQSWFMWSASFFCFKLTKEMNTNHKWTNQYAI